ncbi:MAG: hypothetical protein NZL96_02635 [Patescibacteria group bacterium]|nr:hypothetical protein [Patescibacteria group bacterium]
MTYFSFKSYLSENQDVSPSKKHEVSATPTSPSFSPSSEFSHYLPKLSPSLLHQALDEVQIPELIALRKKDESKSIKALFEPAEWPWLCLTEKMSFLS